LQFVDQARIHVRAGDGGKGAIAFRREKFVPKGGPSGGDGGDGGSVVLLVDGGLSTLLDFRYRKEYQAKPGQPGANKDMYGRAGEDLVLRVPSGTQVFDETTGELIADLQDHGQRFVVARGGQGGRGNMHFATPTDRAPRRSEPGTPGEERQVRLDLKLLADVGLLGFPNVGKSSLIARISAARPKIADYPFTTLVPNLGMVRMSGDRSFVVADIPGLIEGAHEGSGLGDRFLRHLERTRVLVHLLDASAGDGRSPARDYEAINRELALFDPALAQRPQIVVLNKIDLPDVRRRQRTLVGPFARRKIPLIAISAATGEGVNKLLEAMWRVLTHERQRAANNGLTLGQSEPSGVGSFDRIDAEDRAETKGSERKRNESKDSNRTESGTKVGGKQSNTSNLRKINPKTNPKINLKTNPEQSRIGTGTQRGAKAGEKKRASTRPNQRVKKQPKKQA
jgi:GTPase